MKSPRFALREKELSTLFGVARLKAVWKNKVRGSLRREMVRDPLEHLDFHINLDAECKNVQLLVVSGSYVPDVARRILVEKSKGLCRQIVLPSVRDALVLQCLSDAFYADIKGKAPSSKSFFEPEDHAFSKQIEKLFKQPDYGPFRSWLEFQQTIFNFASERKYLVVTDIANYYDTIGYSHLRNIIAGTIDIREHVLDILIFVLSGLLWQPDYMPRIDVGLPQINLDAPRVLAHCFLYELDKFLEESFGGDFARYMDDIDIGVDSYSEAKQILRNIDLILQTRQVRLNSGKTKILTRHEAFDHFRIKENRFLDLLAEFLNRKHVKGKSLDREAGKIAEAIGRLYEAKRFDAGNGEKILKRVVSMATRTQAKLTPSLIRSILTSRPACREVTLTYVQSKPLAKEDIAVLSDFVDSGMIVDDYAIMAIANTLVDAPALNRRLIEREITALMKKIKPRSFHEAYALLWLLSKYGVAGELLAVLRATHEVWQPDNWLGRLVGGLTPVFYRNKSEKAFRNLIASSRNAGAAITHDFHERLLHDVKLYWGVRKFLVAPNSSRFLKISHPKFLMVISVLASEVVAEREKEHLIRTHATAWHDLCYRTLARRVVRPKRLRLLIT